jgi:hypothetical protein
MTDRADPCRRPRPPTSPLLGLAPGGVCPASPVTRTAVRSYRTISPLPHGRRPRQAASESCEAVSFLWHCPGPCGRWVLPTTVPCGARTFLPGSGLPRSRGDRSAHSAWFHCSALPPAGKAGKGQTPADAVGFPRRVAVRRTFPVSGGTHYDLQCRQTVPARFVRMLHVHH